MRGIGWILLFLLFFRLAEAQLGKIAVLFLQDKPEAGGLGLGLDTIGILYGTVGPVALIAGGILGGVAAAYWGFGKTVWPLVCAINLPDIVYVYLAVERPASLWAVGGCIAVEQFGYGLGYTAILLVMVALAENSGRYKTSHFAIMTGITILGMMLVGILSGYAERHLGVRHVLLVRHGLHDPEFSCGLSGLPADSGRFRPEKPLTGLPAAAAGRFPGRLRGWFRRRAGRACRSC